MRSRTRWLVEGECPTKFFCSLANQRHAQSSIASLVHPITNDVVSSSEELIDAAACFYERLYTPSRSVDPAAAEQLLEHLPRLSPEQSAQCDLPLTLADLTEALASSPRGKTPGIDGIPVDFYSVFWPSLGPVLLQVLQECISTGTLTSSIRKGILVLLPKSGDLQLLGNYRPLTMLTADTTSCCRKCSR